MTVFAIDLDQVSIIDGYVPVAIYAVTAVTIVLGLGWRSGIWRRQLMAAIPGAILVTGAVVVLEALTAFVPYDFPWTFYIWFGLVAFCVISAAVGWPGEHAGGRTASLLAIPLSVVLMGQVVNAQYAYYPTVSALGGKVAENELSASDLAALENQVDTAGTLAPTGNVIEEPIPGTTSGFVARNAYVYLPPVYFTDPTPQLPVIMMLHGSPGDPANWTQSSMADQTADAFAAQHGGVAPILVTPDISGSTTADTECIDGAQGNVETYLMTDVVNHMRERFNAASGPGSLAIVGLSTGGFCSLVLSLRHPDEVAAAGDYSGTDKPQLDKGDALQDLFGGDQAAFDAHDPRKILPQRQFPNLGIWFDAGADDSSAIAAQNTIAALARTAGIETCVGTVPGGHDFTVWEQTFERSLPWLSSRLGLTPPPDPYPSECHPR